MNRLVMNKNLVNIKMITAVIIFILIITNCVMAATYYVDPKNGSNANSGNSSNPWETISYAKDKANPGDTVYLRPGSYGRITFDKDDSGNSADGYITYKGDPGTISEIRPADWWSNPFSRLGPSKRPVLYQISLSDGCSYLRFEDIDIEHEGPDAKKTVMVYFSGNIHHIQLINLNMFGYMDDQWVDNSTGSAVSFKKGVFHDILILQRGISSRK